MLSKRVVLLPFVLLFPSMLASLLFALAWASMDHGSTDCPSGWSSLGQNCYQAFTEPATLTEAIEKCRENKGAFLVSIHGEEENDLVSELLQESDGWLNGMLNSQEWLWSDGTAWNYQNWAAGEPIEGSSCLKMSGSGRWVTRDCSASSFVCRLSPTIPPVQPIGNYLLLEIPFAFISVTNATTLLKPESMVGISIMWLPGLCLSLHCLFSSRLDKEVSVKRKLLTSLLLALVPFFVFDILIVINSFCKIPLNPLPIFWFYDNNKILSLNIASIFYGQVLNLVMKFYILTKSPIGSLPYTTYITIFFGIRALVLISTKLFIFKKEMEEEPPGFKQKMKEIFSKMKQFFCCKQSTEEESGPGIKEHIITFLTYLPLFLPNLIFNIMTIVLFFIFCESLGYIWIAFASVFSMIFIFIIIVFFIEELPFLTKVQMAWTNLFVMTLFRNVHDKMEVILSVTLQTVHYFINIVILVLFVFYRPDDYLFVVLTLVFGFLGLVPLAFISWGGELRQAFNNFLKWGSDLCGVGSDGIIPISFRKINTE